MNPNSHSSCTSLSQNVTRSLESNFQIGSHITIGQETFRGGSRSGARSAGWHRAQFPRAPALKEPARPRALGRKRRGRLKAELGVGQGRGQSCFLLLSLGFGTKGCASAPHGVMPVLSVRPDSVSL